ncbi:hypothetical protein [Paracoccus aestuarii]|uniref:hypothetical protein n=1 Tax=Paracoccus aestuarii TaxID=453842 RepID=UPI0011C42CAF|nr:hypothetical protein [Paracoccus aestuarii]WCQ99101.1 hypothetical protein JHW48_14890 [Paracoccus aestuarii]
MTTLPHASMPLFLKTNRRQGVASANVRQAKDASGADERADKTNRSRYDGNMRDPSDLSRQELEQELRQLRAALKRVDEHSKISDGSCAVRTGVATSSELAGRSAYDEPVALDNLQHYLSALARIGARHGIEIRKEGDAGSLCLLPLSPDHGGYFAERVGDGQYVLLSYETGGGLDYACGRIVGDDMHPSARAERARKWREDNAEAIAEENKRVLLWRPLQGQ